MTEPTVTKPTVTKPAVTKYAKDAMHITERELTAMTHDLEDMHHEAMPKFRDELVEWTELRGLRRGVGRLRAASASRRTFLLGAGVTAGGLALAACSKSSSSSTSDTTPGGSTATTTAGGSTASTAGGTGKSQTDGLTGDLAVAGLAAALENTAVSTYQAGIDAATAKKLGAVPPAVVTFAQTAQMQHKEHAGAWNSILTGAGKTAITGGDKTVMDGVVTPAFAKVTDAVGLAMLALQLENVAAATYLNGINGLTSMGAIQKAISIQPVEMQHAAILNYVLGNYPVPDTFAKTDGARPPSDMVG